MIKWFLGFLAILFIFSAGVFFDRYFLGLGENQGLLSPLVSDVKEEALPFLPYTIKNLREYNFEARDIEITGIIQEYPAYTAYKFNYHPLGRKMSGQLNVPNEISDNSKAIVMVRGWAPLSSYYTGMGTKNAAAAFASEGYLTLAPDFFGYGDSEPEPESSWLARFEKPMIVIELIRSIEQNGIPLSLDSEQKVSTDNIGIWAHSNGGQITLTALEILSKPYPTTLWAPVVAPFPYSVLFFSDEDPDEGKDFRKYVADFENSYDVFDFSITQHLPLLTGPIQLHHGSADTAALMIWSDEFFEKVDEENQRRENLTKQITELKEELSSVPNSTDTATISAITQKINELERGNILEPINYSYFRYPGADHNLVPSWNTAISRDIEFFAKEFN